MACSKVCERALCPDAWLPLVHAFPNFIINCGIYTACFRASGWRCYPGLISRISCMLCLPMTAPRGHDGVAWYDNGWLPRSQRAPNRWIHACGEGKAQFGARPTVIVNVFALDGTCDAGLQVSAAIAMLTLATLALATLACSPRTRTVSSPTQTTSYNCSLPAATCARTAG